jgi:hypothetical protein
VATKNPSTGGGGARVHEIVSRTGVATERLIAANRANAKKEHWAEVARRQTSRELKRLPSRAGCTGPGRFAEQSHPPLFRRLILGRPIDWRNEPNFLLQNQHQRQVGYSRKSAVSTSGRALCTHQTAGGPKSCDPRANRGGSAFFAKATPILDTPTRPSPVLGWLAIHRSDAKR